MASMKVLGVPSGLCWRHMASKADLEADTHASSGPYRFRTCRRRRCSCDDPFAITSLQAEVQEVPPRMFWLRHDQHALPHQGSSKGVILKFRASAFCVYSLGVLCTCSLTRSIWAFRSSVMRVL